MRFVCIYDDAEDTNLKQKNVYSISKNTTWKI